MGGFDHALWMGHHAQHIAFGVQNAGNIMDRAVDSFRISKGNTALAFKAVECRAVREIVSVVMRHWYRKKLILFISAGKYRLAIGHGQGNVPADKIDPGIAHQYAWQKADLGQDLKAVTNAQDGYAATCCPVSAWPH